MSGLQGLDALLDIYIGSRLSGDAASVLNNCICKLIAADLAVGFARAIITRRDVLEFYTIDM
jgi:hypothetical protein